MQGADQHEHGERVLDPVRRQLDPLAKRVERGDDIHHRIRGCLATHEIAVRPPRRVTLRDFASSSTPTRSCRT